MREVECLFMKLIESLLKLAWGKTYTKLGVLLSLLCPKFKSEKHNRGNVSHQIVYS